MAGIEPKAIAERIGCMVRERRLDLGLSLEKVALRASMSQTGLWEIEQGRNEPRAGTLLRLCRVLKLSADVLLGVDER